MYFSGTGNFFILLPIHSPSYLQVLNKNGGLVQSIFKDKSLTVCFKVGTAWAVNLCHRIFLFKCLHWPRHWLSCALVKTHTSIKRVQSLSKFANKNLVAYFINIIQYYKYED